MSIQEHLNKIRNAIKGSEVRESIAKGIETAYDDASEKDNANMEVKIARGTHPNLRSRLEETTAQLADKATKLEVNSLANAKADKTEIVDFNNRIDQIIITPAEGITEQEVIDARQGSASLGANLTAFKEDYTQYKTENKIDLKLQYGKNLYNKETMINDSLINSTGSVSNSVGWATSDFIPVNPSSTITFSTARFIAEYDVNKNLIAGTYKDIMPVAKTTIVTGATTTYVRFTGYRGNAMNSAQVEYGETSTPYLEYINPTLVSERGDLVYAENLPSPQAEIKAGGKNLFDKNVIKTSTGLDEFGKEKLFNLWATSDFIPVNPSSTITANKVRYIAEYTKYKTFIGGTYKDNIDPLDTTFITNADTKYIRVTTLSRLVDTLQVEYGSEATYYEDSYYSMFLNDRKIYDLRGSENVAETSLLKLKEYEKYVDREKYQIYKHKEGAKIRALHRDIAVKLNGTTISISTTGINGEYDETVVFNATNFPNLIAGSNIVQILILPWTRNMGSSQGGSDWRILVITDRGQMFHNFPSRAVGSDGTELDGDIIKFDESVVWDLPERKFPSTNRSATGTETYYPGLPSANYEYYPKVNVDNGYNNGGFGKSIVKGSITYPRFYVPSRSAISNSFSPMGGFEPDSKISLLGSYTPNTGVNQAARICIFATDDGGRSWYNKYEFTSLNGVQNFTNPINTSSFDTYSPNKLKLNKRDLVLPNEEVKEPVDKFAWGPDVTVSNITSASTAVATTSTAHNLNNGDVVAFKMNSGTSTDWDWMRNDDVSVSSGGNGKLFRVKVLTSTTFEIYEFVHSAHNNLPARHIHHINRLKDGWLIGTGETYPEGWVMYMIMRQADTFAKKTADSHFTIMRLNSTEKSVQRLIGGHMFDDKDSTLLVAMDNESTYRSNIPLPATRTGSYGRSSTGIYKGRLVDIDKLDDFRVVYEASEVAYFFKQKGGAFIFFGQRGEFAISFDKGETWETENVREVGQHFYGESKKVIAINNFIVVIK